MIPVVWEGVVRDVEEAGHRHVEDLADAEFLIFNGEPEDFPAELPAGVGFVQFVFAGVERLIEAGVIDGSVRWANAGGTYATPVAEIALSLLLAQAHQVKASAQAGSFRGRGALDARQLWLFGPDGPRTVAVVGAGGIGRECIRLLGPFGVRVIAVNRTGRDVPGADEVRTFGELDSVWPRADAVLLAAPLTPRTRGMVGERELAAMKPGAILVNVGRGELVVTDALVDALRGGGIAGAAMDVTDPEPLPVGHPLWALPNATITPHIAATPRIARRLIAPQIVKNAAAFARGDSMPTEVDISEGY